MSPLGPIDNDVTLFCKSPLSVVYVVHVLPSYRDNPSLVPAHTIPSAPIATFFTLLLTIPLYVVYFSYVIVIVFHRTRPPEEAHQR
ncbi:hypothetical protein ES703_87260 [subsurface metagenome]